MHPARAAMLGLNSGSTAAAASNASSTAAAFIAAEMAKNSLDLPPYQMPSAAGSKSVSEHFVVHALVRVSDMHRVTVLQTFQASDKAAPKKKAKTMMNPALVRLLRQWLASYLNGDLRECFIRTWTVIAGEQMDQRPQRDARRR